MLSKQPKPLEVHQRIRDQEAVRVTIIHCLDMLKGIREKLPNMVPDGVDPHSMRKSWLGTAERNLGEILRTIVENEY